MHQFFGEKRDKFRVSHAEYWSANLSIKTYRCPCRPHGIGFGESSLNVFCVWTSGMAVADTIIRLVSSGGFMHDLSPRLGMKPVAYKQKSPRSMRHVLWSSSLCGCSSFWFLFGVDLENSERITPVVIMWQASAC